MPYLTYRQTTGARPARHYRLGRSLTRQLELMPNDKVLRQGSDLKRPKFLTIDDLTQQAEQLAASLKILSASRYPLDIRRGVRKIEKPGEEVVSMTQSESSATVKAGSKTYFFDIRESQGGSRYLVITESSFKGEEGKRERRSIMVFPEEAQNFAQTVTEMTAKLA